LVERDQVGKLLIESRMVWARVRWGGLTLDELSVRDRNLFGPTRAAERLAHSIDGVTERRLIGNRIPRPRRVRRLARHRIRLLADQPGLGELLHSLGSASPIALILE